MKCSATCGQFKKGITTENPILCHALGVCSALAVTAYVKPTLVMGAALMFVASFSCLFVSLLRSVIPAKVRLITQMLIISLFVIIVHLCLKAFYYDMSRTLGPYVGLIITNCLILGRCEAFSLKNKPFASFMDGLGSAAGYAVVLLIISIIRELLGYGTILGFHLLSESYLNNLFISAVPGAFITMGIVVWVIRGIWPEKEVTEHPEAG
ncbi:Rnf-Nqr domain containing protein [Verrucomicrobiota bacterium]